MGSYGFMAPKGRISPLSAVSLYTPRAHRPVPVGVIFLGLGSGSTFWLGLWLGVACRSIPMPARVARSPDDCRAVYCIDTMEMEGVTSIPTISVGGLGVVWFLGR